MVRAISKTKNLAMLNFNILFRPSSFSSTAIEEDAASLLRALKYYSKMFALAFSIYVVAGHFKFYEGDTEWRMLFTIALQLIGAIAIIYILCLALSDRASLLRLTQGALYIDGAFIVTSAAVSVPLSYVDFSMKLAAKNREIDIFSTEHERCIADNSLLYWLLRGDIKFFLYSDVWTPSDWAGWLSQNFQYLLIIPFLPIFATMLRPKKMSSLILICLFTMVAFAAVVEGTQSAKLRLSNSIAASIANCKTDYLDQILSKYAPTLIAPQLIYKLNNSALIARGFSVPLFQDGTNFVLAVQIKEGAQPQWQFVANFPSFARQSYCSDNPYWSVTRRLNYNLLVVMYDKDKSLFHRQLLTAKECAGLAPSTSR